MKQKQNTDNIMSASDWIIKYRKETVYIQLIQAELKIQGNDLFNTCVPDVKINYKGQKLNMDMQNINRNLSITFTYRFNGYKEKKHKEVDRSRFGH